MNKNLFFETANALKCMPVSNIIGGQDGVIHNGKIFRFDHKGRCYVYSADDFKLITEFDLDKLDYIIPHSNSVCLGSEYFSEKDTMPALYTNVYNNYSGDENKHKGECCVYRITDTEKGFASELLQIIKIGFTDDFIWRSENAEDVRPYGNFIVDNKNDFLYAMTMRDKEHITRVFKFKLPKLTDGVKSEFFDGNIVALNKQDIISSFDIEYTSYMQGATFYNGYIYSAEGFTDSRENIPALKVIDVEKQKCVFDFKLPKISLNVEPEFLDVYNEKLFYADYKGKFFKVEFEKQY